MTEEEIKALQDENASMKELVARIYHRTMADPEAERDGSNAILSADEVKAMKAVARDDVHRVNMFLRPAWDAGSVEATLDDLKAARSASKQLLGKALKLYRRDDVCTGSATIAHMMHAHAIFVGNAMDVFIETLEGESAEGVRDPLNTPRWIAENEWPRA